MAIGRQTYDWGWALDENIYLVVLIGDEQLHKHPSPYKSVIQQDSRRVVGKVLWDYQE